MSIKAVSEGNLSHIGIPADCYVLADGRRVLSQRGVVRALTANPDGTGGREGGGLVAYLDRLPEKYRHLAAGAEIRFTTPSGSAAVGREATWFVELLKAYKAAWRAGELHHTQRKFGEVADRYLDALAGVGLAAIIDEASGYEKAREKGAFARLFELLFRPAPSTWAAFIPDSLVHETCRLYRKTWVGGSHPRFMARVNDYIYEQVIGTEAKAELKSRNPDPRFRKNHHQLLTDDARAAFVRELPMVEALMRQSRDPADWRRRMAVHYRRDMLQLELDGATE